jgi:hypothetical protein
VRYGVVIGIASIPRYDARVATTTRDRLRGRERCAREGRASTGRSADEHDGALRRIDRVDRDEGGQGGEPDRRGLLEVQVRGLALDETFRGDGHELRVRPACQVGIGRHDPDHLVADGAGRDANADSGDDAREVLAENDRVPVLHRVPSHPGRDEHVPAVHR